MANENITSINPVASFFEDPRTPRTVQLVSPLHWSGSAWGGFYIVSPNCPETFKSFGAGISFTKPPLFLFVLPWKSYVIGCTQIHAQKTSLNKPLRCYTSLAVNMSGKRWLTLANFSSWWSGDPFEKICASQIGSFFQFRSKKWAKIMETN